MLSGVVASIAAIVYVAHLGQARADTATGYELDAIAAVVLGGTSVFGGRGSLWGTLGGLTAIAVLQNGVHLAALPSELVGVLVGVLLIATIALDRSRGAAAAGAAAAVPEREVTVRNTQVAVLCAAVIAGSLIVAGTNVFLIRSIQSTARNVGRRCSTVGPHAPPGRRDDAEGQG